MLDEDTILKSTRYSNEKILITNVEFAACATAIFSGGDNIFGLCIFFAMGLLALANVLYYPSNWIDAPEFSRTKYLLTALPYLALVVFSIYRITIPSVESVSIEQNSYMVLKDSFMNLESSAYADSYYAFANCFLILSAALIGISICVITQSRFVLQSMVLSCAIFVGILCGIGFFFDLFDFVFNSSLKNLFGENSFSTFKNRENFAVFSYIWAVLTCSTTLYTNQRFSFLNSIFTPRTYFLTLGAILFAASIYTADVSFKPFIFASIAIIGAIYAFDTIPTNANLKRHWDTSNFGAMPKRPIRKALFPICTYSFIAILGVVFCFIFAGKYNLSMSEIDASQKIFLENFAKDTSTLIDTKPLLGWGSDAFSTMLKFVQGDDIAAINWISPLTDIERWRVEFGLVGLGLIFITPAVKLLITLISNKFKLSKAGLIMLSSVVLILVSSTMMTPLQNPCVVVSFMVLVFTFFAWEDAEII